MSKRNFLETCSCCDWYLEKINNRNPAQEICPCIMEVLPGAKTNVPGSLLTCPASSSGSACAESSASGSPAQADDEMKPWA